MSFFFSLCLCFFLCLSSSGFAAPQKMTWAFSSAEHFTDEFRPKLMNEKHPIYLLFVKNLPEYKHDYFFGTVTRIENELKNKNWICYPASTSLESRLPFTYQTSIALLPAPVLVTRKDIAEKFQNKDKSISLKQLVAEKSIEGIFVESRAYGVKIDEILNSKESLIKHQVFAPLGANTMRMIQTHRADFTLEFSDVVDALKKSGHIQDDLVTLPLSDVSGAIKMYAACSKTPEGLQLVKKIDQIVRSNIKNPEYREAMVHGGSTENIRKNYEKEVDQFIKNREKTSEIFQ